MNTWSHQHLAQQVPVFEGHFGVMQAVSKTWSGTSLDMAMGLVESQHAKHSQPGESEEDMQAELADSRIDLL